MTNPIPINWKQVKANDICQLITNGFVGKATDFYTDADDGVTYIQGYNVLKNGFKFKGIKKVTREFHEKNQKSRLMEGDVLIIQTGEVGLTTIVPKSLEGSNCHALIINRFKRNQVFPPYMSQFYNSPYGRHLLKRIETGSTMKHINVGDLKKLKISLPPLPEQHRIVAVLEKWDKSIEKLTRKIELQKNVKKGLMQDLLTGKRRLAGFSEEWEVVKLGNVCEICRGGSPRPIQDFLTHDSDGLNWLKIGDIKKGARFITQTTSKIKKEGLKKTTQVNPGDFILSNSMSFGRPYIMKIQSCIHDGWLAFRNIKNDFDKIFLYYKLTTQEVQNEFKSISAGSGVQNLKKETVEEVSIKFPSKKEQNDIAQILTIADDEITALEKKKQILEEQKRYLLNNLITGQIRTPENLTMNK
jgi:type I restriction enzyme S subunit